MISCHWTLYTLLPSSKRTSVFPVVNGTAHCNRMPIIPSQKLVRSRSYATCRPRTESKETFDVRGAASTEGGTEGSRFRGMACSFAGA